MKKIIVPTINLFEILTTLDWIIFLLVIFITILSVIYGHIQKKRIIKTDNEKESFLDLLLMGRRLTLPLFVTTLVATWYGGIFGVTRIAFEKGIYNFVTQGFFWYITYIIFAIFLIKKIDKYQAITLPDLIGKMFGPKSMKLSAVFNFFNVLPIAYVISIGIFIQLIIGGPLWGSMIIGTSFVLLYSTWGGFRAIVFSDTVQFFVMCIAVFFVLIFSINTFGGIDWLQKSLPDTYFSLTGGGSIAETFVWGFIALSTLVDPNFYQRCFAAKDTKTAKNGIIISTVIWFLFDICTTLGGMYAKAVIPEAMPNHAYLIYAVQIIPSGFRGFFLAGILATILSTLDSYIFLAGTTLSYDLIIKKYRGKIWVHHLGTILVGIIAILMAILFNGNIKTVWKTLGSYSASCLLLPVVAGYLFPGKIKDNDFIFACFLGIIGTTWWRLASHNGMWKSVDELYIGILCTFMGLILPYLWGKINIRYINSK